MKPILLIGLTVLGIYLVNTFISKKDLAKGPDERPAAMIYLHEDKIDLKQAAPERNP